MKISLKRQCALFYIVIMQKIWNLLFFGRLKGLFIENFKFIHQLRNANGKNLFFLINSEIIQWRMSTFFEKEPETIEWINKIPKSSTLFDIGANIGTFSIYAGTREIYVYAFEPEALNFSELCQNIRLNNLDNVKPYSIAISSRENFIGLRPSSLNAGDAKHLTLYQDEAKHTFTTQYCYTMSLDKFLEINPSIFPEYIKIDVDGLERDIVEGMQKTLMDKRLKSVLIEIDERSSEQTEIINIINLSGFKLFYKTNFDFRINNYIFYR